MGDSRVQDFTRYYYPLFALYIFYHERKSTPVRVCISLQIEGSLVDDAVLTVNQKIDLGRRLVAETHAVWCDPDDRAIDHVGATIGGWGECVIVSTDSEVSFVLLVPRLRDDLPQRTMNPTKSHSVAPAQMSVIETDGLVVHLDVAVVAVVERPRDALLVLEQVANHVVHEPLP